MKRIQSKKIRLWDAIHMIAYGDIDVSGNEWEERKAQGIMEGMEISSELAFSGLYSTGTAMQGGTDVDYTVSKPCNDTCGDLCKRDGRYSCNVARKAARALSAATCGSIDDILQGISEYRHGDPLGILIDLIAHPIARTPEFAVSRIIKDHIAGLSIERFCLAVDSIVTAARNGDLTAKGIRKSGTHPETIGQDVWAVSILDPIAGDDEEGELRHKAFYLTFPDDHKFLKLEFDRAEIALLAEAVRDDEPTGQIHKSGAAQTKCYKWLNELMKRMPEKQKPKPGYHVEAMTKFPGLTGRGFNNAWAEAVRDNPQSNWHKSGKIKTKT